MRLCVPIPCFYGDMDFCDAIRKVASLGFDAAETYDWSNLDPEKVFDTCKETGVELVSICTSEFCMTDPKKRSDWVKGLEKTCAVAKRMGVKKLITQTGQDTGRPRSEQHQSILAALALGKPILEENGITLMMEPLNVIVDHGGYYLVHSNEGFELVEEADSPNIKLIFDIYHQQISEGNILPNLLGHLPQIAHLHSAGHPGRHELQLGENNYAYLFEQIDKAGYTGCCGLEYGPTMDPTESLILAKKLFG